MRVGSPDRSTLAAASTASADTGAHACCAATVAAPVPSVQAVSAGRISVAICPGRVRAASIASAPSPRR